jgi:type I restriction enzyme S subunit
MKLSVDPKKADARFIYYYFTSPETVKKIINQNSSSGVPHINLTTLRNFMVRLPEVREQQRIADLISPYDDLISNNKRRIELLEQAARLLFKEWFVHLHYPGHEHDNVIGGVPEEWYPTALGALTTKIGSGATPRGGEASYKEVGITLIRSQNVYDYRFDESGLAFIDDEQAAQLDNVEVRVSDALLNITGASVGRCCMVPEWCLPARVNQHVMIVRANPELIPPYFVLCALNESMKSYLLSVSSGGATREALTKDLVSKLEIVIPTKWLLERFSNTVEPIFKQSELLARQCRALIRARDLLLPRLMDGRISV